MTPNIPIPTDHVYKFHALCGLAFLISSLVVLVYSHDRFNERIVKNTLELAILKSRDNLSQEEELKKQLLSRILEVNHSDRKFIPKALGVFAGMGILMMGYGFIVWHTKVQPNQDRLLELQIKKLEREILGLDQELAKTPLGPADAEALHGARSVTEP